MRKVLCCRHHANVMISRTARVNPLMFYTANIKLKWHHMVTMLSANSKMSCTVYKGNISLSVWCNFKIYFYHHGQVDRTLDSRSEGLMFDSQCWPCEKCQSKLCIRHCLSPHSRNWYLVHRSKVGSIVADCCVRGGKVGRTWLCSHMDICHSMIWYSMMHNNCNAVGIPHTDKVSLCQDVSHLHSMPSHHYCGHNNRLLGIVTLWHRSTHISYWAIT